MLLNSIESTSLAKESTCSLPIIKWSQNSSPKSSETFEILLVMLISSVDATVVPLGWL